jgi:hypothetical protein
MKTVNKIIVLTACICSLIACAPNRVIVAAPVAPLRVIVRPRVIVPAPVIVIRPRMYVGMRCRGRW